MGFFRILKANFGSIKKQREIESAMLLGDNKKTTKLTTIAWIPPLNLTVFAL